MNLPRLLLAPCALAAAALFIPAGAQAQGACAGAESAVSSSNQAAAKGALVCLLNNERTARGIPALAANAGLDQASQAHADDMVARNYKDITAPDGTTPRDRATAAGYTGAQVYGVWLASGSTARSNAQEVIGQAGLCSALIDPAYSDVGVGVALAADGPRFSLTFGGQGTPVASNPSCPFSTLATAPSTPKAAAQALAQQPPTVVAGQLGLPATKSCQSRRAFYVRVRETKSIRLTKATLSIGGRKSVAVRRGGRLRALVDLRGFSKGSFQLKITATTTTGVKLVGYRKYKTCAGNAKL